jgi:hypothetical protein
MTAAQALCIEHSVTADMADGQPLPPSNTSRFRNSSERRVSRWRLFASMTERS